MQLDVMFAYAHQNNKNPVKLSLTGEMPKPGTRDAEAALSRAETENQETTVGAAEPKRSTY